MSTDTLAYAEDTLAHTEDTHAHAEDTHAHEPRNIHATKCLRTCSRIVRPGLSSRSRSPSCGPPGPGDNLTRQLCHPSALVPLPDRSTVVTTLAGVRRYR